MIIIETTIFTRRIQSALPEEDYRELQNYLVENPVIGKIIKGTGGLRKLRWGGSDRGKRGGSRIIYYWQKDNEIILMLFIFRKNESDNLSVNQLKSLRNIVEREFNEKRII